MKDEVHLYNKQNPTALAFLSFFRFLFDEGIELTKQKHLRADGYSMWLGMNL